MPGAEAEASYDLTYIDEEGMGVKLMGVVTKRRSGNLCASQASHPSAGAGRRNRMLGAL